VFGSSPGPMEPESVFSFLLPNVSIQIKELDFYWS